VYTIGEVSKIVKISANALRYYDEIGILKPSLIQENNQYRYYSESQIKDIIFILELKQYGFTLYEIKDLLQNNSKVKLKFMLEEKRAKLDSEILRLRESSILLEKRIAEIVKGEDFKMNGGKVLIVDDFVLVRIMIKNIIEQYGYTVAGEASNGEEAIRAYENLKPDLVIMDITMPIMDGIYAAAKITEKHKDARIIMCSGMSYAPLVLEGIKSGARDFVSKPFSSLRLIKAMAMGLDGSLGVDGKKVDYVSEIIKSHMKESALSRVMVQEEVDTLIYDIIKNDAEDEAIYNFIDKINNNCTNKIEAALNEPSKIEEMTIENLKDKFIRALPEMADYLSSYFNNECIINFLTAQNITMSEFKTLIDDSNSLGSIKYKTSNESLYIHICSDDVEGKGILKELTNFTVNKLKLFESSYSSIDVNLNSNDIKAINDNYSIVLISFSIKFDDDKKIFASLSIPHGFLKYLC
jgi:two-component system chemotaxis response regulator CheY